MNRKRIPLLLVVTGLVAAATAYSMGWFHRDTTLQGSGTVEARNIRVGSKVGGRIDKILVREGDTVEPGQLLITFDDKELLASLAESRAAAEKAAARFSSRRNRRSARRRCASQSRIRSAQKRLSPGRHRRGPGRFRSRHRR